MSSGNVMSNILVTLFILVVVFLVLREFFCWYWKINQRVALLTEIRDLAKAAAPIRPAAPEPEPAFQRVGALAAAGQAEPRPG